MPIEKKRITGRFCPTCQCPVVYYGSLKHAMVICLNDECRNLIKYEDSLRMEDTEKGQNIYKEGYGSGFEDGEMVGSCKKEDTGFLDEIEEGAG